MMERASALELAALCQAFAGWHKTAAKLVELAEERAPDHPAVQRARTALEELLDAVTHWEKPDGNRGPK